MARLVMCKPCVAFPQGWGQERSDVGAKEAPLIIKTSHNCHTSRLRIALCWVYRTKNLTGDFMQLERTKLEDIMMAMVGVMSYAVFAADGTQLALFESEEMAFYNAVKHNLAPVSIH